MNFICCVPLLVGVSRIVTPCDLQCLTIASRGFEYCKEVAMSVPQNHMSVLPSYLPKFQRSFFNELVLLNR